MKQKARKDRNIDLYKQGFKDATTTGWFRWKKHPALNAYRLGYNAGLKQEDK